MVVYNFTFNVASVFPTILLEDSSDAVAIVLAMNVIEDDVLVAKVVPLLLTLTVIEVIF